MRSMDVIVVHENGGNSFEMSLVQDEQLIETLGTNSAHESLCHTIRLRGAKRGANDLDARASKHLVKTVGELLVPARESGSGTPRGVQPTPKSVAGPVV